MKETPVTPVTRISSIHIRYRDTREDTKGSEKTVMRIHIS